MRAIEVAVAHGYLSATVKDYAAKRQRRSAPAPTQTGHVNVSGWEKLAAIWKGPVQHGGERFVGEVAGAM